MLPIWHEGVWGEWCIPQKRCHVLPLSPDAGGSNAALPGAGVAMRVT